MGLESVSSATRQFLARDIEQEALISNHYVISEFNAGSTVFASTTENAEVGKKAASLKTARHEAAKLVERELANTSGWLEKVAKKNPDAVIHAKKIKIDGENGAPKKEVTVLYAKPKPGNWFINLIDYLFNHGSRSLASLTLFNLVSASGHIRAQAGSNKARGQEVAGNLLDASGKLLCAGKLSKGFEEVVKPIAISRVKDSLTSDMFDNRSIPGGFLWYCAHNSEVATRPAPADSRHGHLPAMQGAALNMETVDKLEQQGFSAKESGIFKSFIEGVETRELAENESRKIVIKYAEDWSRKYNDLQDKSFKNLVDGNPALRKWNVVANYIANRFDYFSIQKSPDGNYCYSANDKHQDYITEVRKSCEAEIASDDVSALKNQVVSIATQVVEACSRKTEEIADIMRNGADETHNSVKDFCNTVQVNLSHGMRETEAQLQHWKNEAQEEQRKLAETIELEKELWRRNFSTSKNFFDENVKSIAEGLSQAAAHVAAQTTSMMGLISGQFELMSKPAPSEKEKQRAEFEARIREAGEGSTAAAPTPFMATRLPRASTGKGTRTRQD